MQDGVVPRTNLEYVLQEIERLGQLEGVERFSCQSSISGSILGEPHSKLRFESDAKNFCVCTFYASPAVRSEILMFQIVQI